MSASLAAKPNWVTGTDERVIVMLAHNDDNGNPSGRAGAMEIEFPKHKWFYEGAGVYGPGDGPVCRVDEYNGVLRLGRHKYRWLAHMTHVGNIVWDWFRLSPEEGKRLKETQEKTGWWQVTGETWTEA